VPKCLAIRRRLPSPISALLSLALAGATTRFALASVLTKVHNCNASGDSLKCHLQGILDFLYAAAGILGLLLVVAVVLAFNIYRKNKADEKVDS
jgi:hypothetical protein